MQFRLRYLGNKKRETEALVAVAEKAQWQQRPSPAPGIGSKAIGRGVALSSRSGTLVAVVADVEVDKSSGKVSVKRMRIFHDCGLIVNPDGLKNQIEGNVIQAVSRALFDEVQFDATQIRTLDWSRYPVLTFADVPEIDIVLINRPEMEALGAGEPSIVPVTGAIANAIFDATGARLRDVPFTPARVLAALKTVAAGS